MSDEPRDDLPAGTPEPTGPLGDAVDDGRMDGSRTDVSAPWERPRRWERSGPATNRVDALLERLGDGSDDDVDSGPEPDTRRSRRRNQDGEALPAGALIAALGEAAQHEAAIKETADAEAAGDDAAPAGDTTHADAEHETPSAVDEVEPVTASTTGDGGPSTGQSDDDRPPVPGQDDDTHTDTLPAAGTKSADLAEAGAIRAALDRQAGLSSAGAAADTGADTATGAPGRRKAGRKAAAGKAAAGASSAAGPTLVHGSRPRRHRGWLYAGRTIAALVAFCTLLGVGVEWKIKDRAEVSIEENATTVALNTTDPSISTARTTAVVRTNSQGVKTTMSAPPKTVYPPENILLLGSDTRSGGNAAIGGSDSSTDGTANSDTLMVAHISGDREHVTVLSIPRDTLIPAPRCKVWNSSTGKLSTQDNAPSPGQIYHINSAYSVGGPTCTVTAVQSLTGLGINRMIGIDFKGFQAMVDALGGVTVNVCRPIQDAVLGTVVANGGVQVIHGAQAISLVRARDVIGDTQSDLARIRRQQVVLSAILRQVTQAGTLLNPGRLDGFLQAFSKNTFTQNVKLEDLVTLAGSLGTLDPAHVTFYTLPTVPSTVIDGALDVDKPKAAAVFDDLVNDLPLPGEVTTPAKPKPTATATPPAAVSLKLTVPPSKVNLELYNVTGRDNVAGMAQGELDAAGFQISDDQLFKPARTQSAILVQYAPANRAAALTVAAAVPGSTLVVTPGLGNTVRLQIGSSFAGLIKTVAVGQQAPPSLSTAVSTGPSVSTTAGSTPSSTGLSSVNAGAGTCA